MIELEPGNGLEIDLKDDGRNFVGRVALDGEGAHPVPAVPAEPAVPPSDPEPVPPEPETVGEGGVEADAEVVERGRHDGHWMHGAGGPFGLVR